MSPLTADKILRHVLSLAFVCFIGLSAAHAQTPAPATNPAPDAPPTPPAKKPPAKPAKPAAPEGKPQPVSTSKPAEKPAATSAAPAPATPASKAPNSNAKPESTGKTATGTPASTASKSSTPANSKGNATSPTSASNSTNAAAAPAASKAPDSSASAPTSAANSQSPPALMHWCSQHCATWVWVGNRYVGQGTPHPEQTPECGVTVERFAAESVVMHRTDCGPYPGKATLTGKLSPGGDSIVDGSIAWTWHPCCGTGTGTFTAAWGNALSTVPGSDQERAINQQRGRTSGKPR